MADDERSLRRTVADLEQEVNYLRARLRRAEADADEIDDAAPGPFFVGGTGRSGTWMLGRLLGQHPDVAVIRTELRFHSSEGGFGRVLRGEESIDEFTDRVRSRWYGIAGASGSPKGLLLLATSGELSEATKRLRADGGDPASALRAFAHRLVDPYAHGRGARTWVETTPDNTAATDVLLQVFPRARVFDIVRDGRDVAASVVTMAWGPDSPDDALDWWAARVRAGHAAMARADADRVMRVRFEEFALTHREQRLDEVLACAGFERTKAIERYFARAVDPEKAHTGRWRAEMSSARAAAFDARYRDLYRELEDEGVAGLPITPDDADRLGV
ncbi:MAG: sulfotransferase [Acidimicrobiales bacterium]|nr:sulfotransferase [Acidimicrobiales bacterium]